MTRGQRSKEESSDYRYFPDPDLPPVTVNPSQIAAARERLGELPADLRNRLALEWDLVPADAEILVNQGRGVVDYFLEVAQTCEDGKQASNWVQRDVLRRLKDESLDIDAFPVSARRLGELIRAIAAGKLQSSRAADVFQEMWTGNIDCELAMSRLGIVQVDEQAIVALCRDLLAAHPQIVLDVRNGKQQAVGALIGRAKSVNPNVDPGLVRTTCLRLIQEQP